MALDPSLITATTVVVFGLVYAGMALGRWPGLAMDRTGVALFGAILLFALGALPAPQALESIDFPTLGILFALMVLSAQVAASGFFERCVRVVAASPMPPDRLLLATVLLSGGLAAVLTNDVVVWAMVPLLVAGLTRRDIDARPFVIATACAANAGSAATLIGNPQNIIIGQHAHLPFWGFVAVCGVPALAALGMVWGVTRHVWRRELTTGGSPAAGGAQGLDDEPLDRPAGIKALVALLAVVTIFTLPVDRAPWSLGVAAVLLVSRRLSTRRMLSMVDWNVLLLFVSLFVVTGAFSATGLADRALEALRLAGIDILHSGSLAVLSLLGSNSIGNVPLVVMLLAAKIHFSDGSAYALALFSTLSGNFLITGSIANIIAVERAAPLGVKIGFGDYARIGVPVTLASLAFAGAWLWLIRG
jgi:Na+/H+ antiporter NhaD/arsenite permease-like protein